MTGSDQRSDATTDRRRLLKGVGVSLASVTLAGCSSGDTPTDAGGNTDAGEDTATPTATATATPPDEIPTGGTLQVAAPGDPQNLDPHTTTIDVAQMVLDNVVEGLFELDNNLDVQPVLAEGYEISDDETTYEVSLKEGVTFHNGDEFTSADVAYTIERILDPDLGSPRAANFQLVDDVATPDDTTVRFELSQPFAPFLIGLAESAGIVPEGIADEVNLKQNPVGTGPFALEAWDTDEQVSLTAFDDYHREERPRLDGVRFDVIPEAATRRTQLGSGSAHVMFGVPPQQASRINDASNTNLQSVSGLWKQAFWFNTDAEPFTDPQVRRAISHALNRQQFVQGVLFGQGQAAHSPVPPTSSWNDRIETGAPHEYSRQTAQSMLEDADVDPSSLSTTIKASRTPGPTYADTATLAQSMLAQLGISVDVEIMDFSTWLQEVWVDKNFELSVGSWAGRIDPDGWYFRQYHSEGPWNRWNYANDEVDALLEQGRTTTDPAERGEIYGQIDRIVSEDAPMVYLYFRKDLTGLKNSVGGYRLSPTHQAEFEDTYIEQ